MRRFSYFPFPWVIIACGLISLCFVVGNFAVLGLKRHPAEPRKYVISGNVEQGRAAIKTYGCGGCHVIPGVEHAVGRVGPRLSEFADQSFVGGVLPNTPENVVAWIQNPTEAAPRTAMPDLGVTEADARDIAAYLYSL